MPPLELSSSPKPKSRRSSMRFAASIAVGVGKTTRDEDVVGMIMSKEWEREDGTDEKLGQWETGPSKSRQRDAHCCDLL